MKNIKYSRLKKHRRYTTSELSYLLGVHIDTVRSWVKRGLKPICRFECQYLFIGCEVISFLETERTARKCKLKDNEIYCVVCKKPSVTPTEHVKIVVHCDDLLSKYYIYGICQHCGREIQRFSSEKECLSWQKHNWVLTENVDQLYGVNKYFGYTDFEKKEISQQIRRKNVG